jgi:hypothetical protein
VSAAASRHREAAPMVLPYASQQATTSYGFLEGGTVDVGKNYNWPVAKSPFEPNL